MNFIVHRITAREFYTLFICSTVDGSVFFNKDHKFFDMVVSFFV